MRLSAAAGCRQGRRHEQGLLKLGKKAHHVTTSSSSSVFFKLEENGRWNGSGNLANGAQRTACKPPHHLNSRNRCKDTRQ